MVFEYLGSIMLNEIIRLRYSNPTLVNNDIYFYSVEL